MPYLLTPEAKYRIIQGEAMLQKREHMSHGAMQVRAGCCVACVCVHAVLPHAADAER